jgi:hypothetical protein
MLPAGDATSWRCCQAGGPRHGPQSPPGPGACGVGRVCRGASCWVAWQCVGVVGQALPKALRKGWVGFCDGCVVGGGGDGGGLMPATARAGGAGERRRGAGRERGGGPAAGAHGRGGGGARAAQGRPGPRPGRAGPAGPGGGGRAGPAPARPRARRRAGRRRRRRRAGAQALGPSRRTRIRTHQDGLCRADQDPRGRAPDLRHPTGPRRRWCGRLGHLARASARAMRRVEDVASTHLPGTWQRHGPARVHSPWPRWSCVRRRLRARACGVCRRGVRDRHCGCIARAASTAAIWHCGCSPRDCGQGDGLHGPHGCGL